MRLLLLIIGLVLGSYVLFTALAKSRLGRSTRSHEEFDQTLIENTHAAFKPSMQDPLLDEMEIVYDEFSDYERLEAPLTEDSVFNDQDEALSDPPSSSHQQDIYAWESDLAQEEEEAYVASKEKPQMREDKFIAICILPKNKIGFTGHTLLSALKVNYFHLGKQKVFNRHMGDDPHQSILFSVASLVEPGTFDLHQMSKNIFAGIVIYMVLPSPGNAMTTFEKMFITARQLANSLNGELCDFKRNPLNLEMLGYYRDLIRSSSEEKRAYA